ncbi:MAG: endonuclease/exonuclease/phosphatase family protein [Clostridia bacterium]|nr:endonuclease/exonuclease/phosphatase family protein [Clostridia bacterium]
MNVKIMSFNTQHCLNFVTRRIDFSLMASVIREQGADIVGLQEIRGKGMEVLEFRPQAKILAEKLGYHYFFGPAIKFAGVNPYGNALLSRFPIISAKVVRIPDPKKKECKNSYYETRCIISATVDVEGAGPLNVLVSHFGLNPDEQRNAVRFAVKTLKDNNCVLMGDFNVVPDDPVLAPIKERMFDTAELFAEPKLSFPSPEPDRKIDYIFASRDLKVLSADIPAIVASDHRPYVAVIEL